MRCPHCDAWVTPDLTACSACKAPLRPAGEESVYEKYQRQIRATGERFAGVSDSPLVAPDRPVEIEATAIGVLNYLLFHAGFSPLRWVILQFPGPEAAAGARLELVATPQVVLPKTILLDDVRPPRASLLDLDPPAVEPDGEAFFGLDEAVPGQLRLTVLGAGGERLAETDFRVSVQSPGEWINAPGCEAALVGAVTPGSEAVRDLVGQLPGDFVAYQAPGRADEEIARVYDGIRALDLSYVGAPPSFASTGQKVLFPDQVLAGKRGCCLDLVVLTAAVLERVGYHPLLILTRDDDGTGGHALCGAWTAEVRAKEPVLRGREVLDRALADGDLVIWNPTTPFDREGDPSLAAAEASARRQLARCEYALDLAACRQHGYQPVSRRAR